MAHLGKMRRDETLTQMARVYYGSALRRVHAVAARGRRDHTALAAINLISMYEVCITVDHWFSSDSCQLYDS